MGKNLEKVKIFKEIKPKYKVDENINSGYTNWRYFRNLKEAKKYVKSNPNYPMVRQNIYKVI